MRSSRRSDKAGARLARLAKRAATINAEIEALLEAADAAEVQELKKLASIRDTKVQVAPLDDSILTELQWLIEKYFMPRTPWNLELILLELLRLLSKIVWKLFILQGLKPPPMDPRLLSISRRSRAGTG